MKITKIVAFSAMILLAISVCAVAGHVPDTSQTQSYTDTFGWEVKTDDGSIHDKDKTYTWYDSNHETNVGNAGISGSILGFFTRPS